MFSVTYGKGIRFITFIFFVILIGLPSWILISISQLSQSREAIIVVIPVVIFITSLYFTVTGFELKKTEFVIRRIGKNISIPLNQIVSAEFVPKAIRGSFRIFGIGGVFGYYGSFSNSIVGDYTAYATNNENTVVIKLKLETIVVTPNSPQEFVFKIKKYI